MKVRFLKSTNEGPDPKIKKIKVRGLKPTNEGMDPTNNGDTDPKINK